MKPVGQSQKKKSDGDQNAQLQCCTVLHSTKFTLVIKADKVADVLSQKRKLVHHIVPAALAQRRSLELAAACLFDSMTERRIDPATGAALTYQELVATYRQRYTRQQIKDPCPLEFQSHDRTIICHNHVANHFM